MTEKVRSPHLKVLRDRIDLTETPFSTRGSRLLLYRHAGKDALFLKFAERLMALEADLEAHRQRRPYLDNLELIDEKAKPLSFQITTYPHALFLETSIGVFKVVLNEPDSLIVGVPDGCAAGVRLRVNNFYSPLKSLLVRTNGELVKQESTPIEGGVQKEYITRLGIDVALTFTCERQGVSYDQPVGFSEALARAEALWDAWFARVPTIAERYRDHYYYAWWVMANNLVSPLGHLQYEAMMPSKHQYIGIWNWDACFHAVALRHADPELAKGQLRTMLHCQLPDGMIPDVVHDEGVVDWIDHPVGARVTKPPVMAWAALKIFESDEDEAFLQEIYPALVRWNRWWFDKRASGIEGLAEYRHPYSSGLDNNPLWDHGFPVVSPDLNTYLVVQMDSLATIAEILGDAEGARTWRRRAEMTMESMVASLYDCEQGLFWALQNDKRIPEITPFNLYPLWTGRLPEEIEVRLIEHLVSPTRFWTNFPLATVAKDTPNYDPKIMWRGPAWININYIFHEALQRAGRETLAQQLNEHTIELISRNEGIFEYYNPETGVPPSTAAPSFGWSSALFVDLVLACHSA